jgi:hypothetical protein
MAFNSELAIFVNGVQQPGTQFTTLELSQLSFGTIMGTLNIACNAGDIITLENVGVEALAISIPEAGLPPPRAPQGSRRVMASIIIEKVAEL